MGLKICSGIGFGIQLSEEQKKKYSYEYIDGKLEEYAKNFVKKLKENSKKERPLDDISFDYFIEYFPVAMELFGEVKKLQDLTDADFEKIEMGYYEKLNSNFLYPQHEYGSHSFFGYLFEQRYNDPMDWAMIAILNINQSTFENAEVPLKQLKISKDAVKSTEKSIIVKDCLEIQVPYFYISDCVNHYKDNEGNEVYMPKTSILNYLYIMTKNRLEDGDNVVKYTLGKSEEEVKSKLKAFMKKYGIKDNVQFENALAGYYNGQIEKAHDIIKMFYDVEERDITRYVVFWLS